MAFKLIAGDKLAQFEAALSANGLSLHDELETGFAGLLNVKAHAMDAARADVAEEVAGLVATAEAAEARASNAEAKAKEAEEKAASATAEALKADRETPVIPVAHGDAVDHRSAWEAMPEKTAKERQQKAAYFAKHLNNKGA